MMLIYLVLSKSAVYDSASRCFVQLAVASSDFNNFFLKNYFMHKNCDDCKHSSRTKKNKIKTI